MRLFALFALFAPFVQIVKTESSSNSVTAQVTRDALSSDSPVDSSPKSSALQAKSHTKPGPLLNEPKVHTESDMACIETWRSATAYDTESHHGEVGKDTEAAAVIMEHVADLFKAAGLHIHAALAYSRLVQVYEERGNSTEIKRINDRTAGMDKLVELKRSEPVVFHEASCQAAARIHLQAAALYQAADLPLFQADADEEAARLYEEAESYAEAAELYEKAAMLLQTAGSHWSAVIAYKSSAKWYKVIGKLDAAARMNEQAADMHEVVGVHCSAASEYDNAAKLYTIAGKLDDAARAREKAAKALSIH